MSGLLDRKDLLRWGEFWLIDGKAVAADRDSGGRGHADVVRDWLAAEFDKALRCVKELSCERRSLVRLLRTDVVAARCWLLDWADAQSRTGGLATKDSDDVHEWLRGKTGWPEDRYDLLFDSSAAPEIREWAVLELDWIRVLGQHCQVKALDRGSLSRIVSGLLDAYGDLANRGAFCLEVGAVRSANLYMDVPWSVLAQQRLTALRPYRRR